MRCNKCMHEAAEGSLFCPNCGNSLASAPAAAVEAEVKEPAIAAEDPVKTEEPEAESAEVPVLPEEAPASEISFCPECGSKMEPGSLFCGNCGMRAEAEPPKAPETSFCPECGSSVETEAEFCGSCGHRLLEAPAPGAAPVKTAGKTKLPLILGGAAVIAAAAIAVIAIPKLMSGGSGSDTVMYLKDGSMYSASLKNLKKDPVEYTDDAYKSSSGISGMIYQYPTISPDGKYKFYLENMDYDDGYRISFTLYYKKNDKDKGEKIDSNITSYEITPDNKVVYIKNNALYVSDLKDKSKIASNVGYFHLEEGGKRVLWTERDNTTYTDTVYYSGVSLDGEKEKLSDEVLSYYIGEDFNTIYLVKNDAVYLAKNLEDEEKLVNNITGILSVDPGTNSFYYTEYEETEVSAIDFVEDDMAAADAQAQEPRMEDFQSQETVNYGWSSGQRTVTDYDAYYAARDKYREKLKRDELREALRNRKLTVSESRLYYYSDGEETLISEDLAEVVHEYYSSEQGGGACPPYVLFTQFESENMEKRKLSELNYASDADNAYYEARRSSTATCLVSGGVTVPLDLDEEETFVSYSFAVDKQKGMLYKLVQEDPEDSEYRLVSIDLNAKTLGQIIEMDEDVDCIEAAGNGYVYYIKEAEKDGELYCNGEKLLSDVASYKTRLIEDGAAAVCMADWNYNSGDGTLVLLQGNKKTEIADDITDWYSLGNHTFLLLSEYNYEKRRGDLKYYDGKQVQSVEDDVRAVFCPVVEE